MTLKVGSEVALSGLLTTTDQIGIISRNVSNANDPKASRKIANVVTVPGGGVRIASITRAADAALLEKMLGATSDSNAQQAIVDALNQLDTTINDPQLDVSPAALLTKFQNALQSYSAAPQSALGGQAAVAAAKNLAQSLKD